MTDNKDDRELEQYLAGKDGLARQYKSVAGETPPSQIDEAILAASRKAVGAKPGRFMLPYFGCLDAPLAIAAVVVLSVLVVFNLPDESLDTAIPSETEFNTNRIAEDRATAQEAIAVDESAAVQRFNVAPVMAPAPVTSNDFSAGATADDAQAIVEMQKAMRMQTEEEIANSESARLMQPPPEIVISEPAQMESYTDSSTSEAGQSQFTACTMPRPQVCTMEYLPVCATRDTGFRCVTTPCDSTEQVEFANACNACGDPDVIGYAPGSCPAAGNRLFLFHFPGIPNYCECGRSNITV